MNITASTFKAHLVNKIISKGLSLPMVSLRELFTDIDQCE